MLTADPSLSEMIMIPLCYFPLQQISLPLLWNPQKGFGPLEPFPYRMQPLLQNKISIFMCVTEREKDSKGNKHFVW